MAQTHFTFPNILCRCPVDEHSCAVHSDLSYTLTRPNKGRPQN